MININSIKALITYTVSLDVILLSVAKWLTTFNNHASNILATIVSAATLVVTYYSIIHLKEKIISTRLDNESKKLDNELKKIDLKQAKDKDKKKS